MADDTRDVKPEAVDTALGEMKLEEGATEGKLVNGTHGGISTPADLKGSLHPTLDAVKFESRSPPDMHNDSPTPKSEDEEHEEFIGGDITVTVEPGKAPKLLRKSSQKVITRPAQLFDDLEDSTEEALSVFQVIKDCIYGSKYMGYSEHDALDCDCSEEWSKFTSVILQAVGYANIHQGMPKIMPAGKIRIVSTVRRKWNVLMETAIVEPDAKINDFSADSMPTSQSSRLRRKAMVYG